jgi:ATP:ADP antiporter, AAA family
VLTGAREALEQHAAAHIGMLIDAMLDPSSDFTIRRRLPRILGTVATRRSVDGLLNGLNDQRFEVRYHCGRAISRILVHNEELSVDRARMITSIERELDVPPQLWRGYRLFDRPDEPAPSTIPADVNSRHLEYIFLLLSTIIPREPLDAAVQGVQSANAGVRGLALEYLHQVLPPAVAARLRAMMESTTSDADVPELSSEPPPARQP